jgi:PAS domain S-box-containing protein
MDCHGIVLDVNRAFTNNFGYNNEEIKGKNFSILYTQDDNNKNTPGLELETVLSKGQANDENYIINRDGHAVWCTGESMLVAPEEEEKYIVKDIVNLQARKQLQLFLRGTEDMLQRIFESSKDIPMMILDGGMKVIKANAAFLKLFEIEQSPESGSRLSDLHHPFWDSEEIKNEVRKMLVTNEPIKQKEFLLTTKSNDRKVIVIDSKIIDKHSNKGREIFIILEDVTP